MAFATHIPDARGICDTILNHLSGPVTAERLFPNYRGLENSDPATHQASTSSPPGHGLSFLRMMGREEVVHDRRLLGVASGSATSSSPQPLATGRPVNRPVKRRRESETPSRKERKAARHSET